jgi:hypothetical protein
MSNNQRPGAGAVLRWVFAGVVGFSAGVICWFYVGAVLNEGPLKKLEESDSLSRRWLFDGNVRTREEDMQRAGRLLEEANAGMTSAYNKALLAAGLASGITTFLCGIALRWLMGIRPKIEDGKEEIADISTEPDAPTERPPRRFE